MPASPKFHGEWIGGNVELTIPVILRNTSDNREATGVAYSDVTAYYWRETKSPVQITMSPLSSITDWHTGGGAWYEVSSTNMPGVYRLDVPDLAIDDEDGVNFVTICVQVPNCYAYIRTITIETYSRTNLYNYIDNATFGLQKLVRAETPANKLKINSDGYADANVQEWKDNPPVALNADNEVVVGVSRFTGNGLSQISSTIEGLLSTTNRSEPSAGAPPDLPTIVQMLQYLYMGFKNQLTSTNSTLKVFNKDGTALMQSTLSDDGTTFTRAKFVAP